MSESTEESRVTRFEELVDKYGSPLAAHRALGDGTVRRDFTLAVAKDLEFAFFNVNAYIGLKLVDALGEIVKSLDSLRPNISK